MQALCVLSEQVNKIGLPIHNYPVQYEFLKVGGFLAT